MLRLSSFLRKKHLVFHDFRQAKSLGHTRIRKAGNLHAPPAHWIEEWESRVQAVPTVLETNRGWLDKTFAKVEPQSLFLRERSSICSSKLEWSHKQENNWWPCWNIWLTLLEYRYTARNCLSPWQVHKLIFNHFPQLLSRPEHTSRHTRHYGNAAFLFDARGFLDSGHSRRRSTLRYCTPPE